MYLVRLLDPEKPLWSEVRPDLPEGYAFTDDIDKAYRYKNKESAGEAARAIGAEYASSVQFVVESEESAFDIYAAYLEAVRAEDNTYIIHCADENQVLLYNGCDPDEPWVNNVEDAEHFGSVDEAKAAINTLKEEFKWNTEYCVESDFTIYTVSEARDMCADDEDDEDFKDDDGLVDYATIAGSYDVIVEHDSIKISDPFTAKDSAIPLHIDEFAEFVDLTRQMHQAAKLAFPTKYAAFLKFYSPAKSAACGEY